MLEIIECHKGEEEFQNFTQFGMEKEMKKYLEGLFSIDFHNFYERNKNYFNVYSNESEDLKKMFERYNSDKKKYR